MKFRKNLRKQRLEAGDAAPKFQAVDALGKTVTLADYGESYILLVFLRYSGCPFCNLTIHRLAIEYSMLSKSGCEVIAFVQSDNNNIRRNIYDRHQVRPQFPIIGDAERKLYDLYGITMSVKAGIKSIKDIPYWMQSVYKHGYHQTEVDGKLLMVPAMFLIGPDEQKIIKAQYGSSFYDHTTFTNIYEPLTFGDAE